jgi:hypothetical protein
MVAPGRRLPVRAASGRGQVPAPGPPWFEQAPHDVPSWRAGWL